MGVLVQLILLPLVIVTVMVLVVLFFGWLAHTGGTPRGYVDDLRDPDRASWHSAANLNNLLTDPRHEQLRHDRVLAGELADLLKKHLRHGNMDENAVHLRALLCRALGEFCVVDGLPALIEAARLERDEAEIHVRLSALEAIAVLADNTGPSVVRENADVLPALAEAAQEGSAPQDAPRGRELLRERAAFALGVFGGEKARQMLAVMLSDRCPNVRYNAATGLARHGDERAVSVLTQMLAADNSLPDEGELGPKEVRQGKRNVILLNALRATAQLAAQNPSADLTQLKSSVAQLVEAEVDRSIRLEAAHVLDAMTRRKF